MKEPNTKAGAFKKPLLKENKENLSEDRQIKQIPEEKSKVKAYPVADAKLTVKILDLIQQAMNYKQVLFYFSSVFSIVYPLKS